MPPISWVDAPTEETTVELVIARLGEGGALAEAEELSDRIDAGIETSPILAPEEIRRRLARYDA